ncbi:MAG: hypothetical protein U1E17_02965 [Geminicoccaceae bacterium]
MARATITPRDDDRRQLGHGRQGAGAADLDRDRLHHGLGLLGANLCAIAQRSLPADEAQPLLQVDPVDLVDHAVDVVGQGDAAARRSRPGRRAALRRPRRRVSRLTLKPMARSRSKPP